MKVDFLAQMLALHLRMYVLIVGIVKRYVIRFGSTMTDTMIMFVISAARTGSMIQDI